MKSQEAKKIAKDIYTNNCTPNKPKNELELLADEITYNIENGLEDKPIQFKMKNNLILNFKATDIINQITSKDMENYFDDL